MKRNRFFTLSLDLLSIAGLDGHFRQLNPSWERTLGYTPEELKRRPLLEFVHPDDREATLGRMRTLEAGEPVIGFESRYRARDGSYRWLVWNAAPHMEERLIYAVAHDVTERKQAELALQLSNQELETLSYSASHDLRAPLRGMGLLIDALLHPSRMSRMELRTGVVDLSALARMVARELQERDPRRKVVFVSAEGVTARGDATLLRVALENLLGNAWKFTGKREDARIEFGVETNGGWPVYSVRDNGAGFVMQYAGKLFGPFQRLHGEAEFPGTGIGLATVQRVVRRHGGRVWAESALDRGTAIHFTLGGDEQDGKEDAAVGAKTDGGQP